jgi:hypothetical protein
MSRKAAIALRSHVCDRLKERFDISIDINGFNELNYITINSPILYDSEIENCDFREVHFMDKKMVCIFDTKLNKVKTVLIPFSLAEGNFKPETDTLELGKKVEGNLLYIRPNYGAFILLNDKFRYYIGVLHESEIKPDVDLNKNLKYIVISNRIEKKGKTVGKRRIFLKLI